MGLFSGTHQGNTYRRPSYVNKYESGPRDYTAVFEVGGQKIPLPMCGFDNAEDVVAHFWEIIGEAIREAKETDSVPTVTIQYEKNGEPFHPFSFRADWVAGVEIYKGRRGFGI